MPNAKSPNYTPTPIDTGGTRLPPEIEGLTERLAEHVHDVWALEKLAQGWTHGEKTDPDAKTHAMLVPYGHLPESDKQYDRQTAVGTLKAILALGYRILPAEKADQPGSGPA